MPFRPPVDIPGKSVNPQILGIESRRDGARHSQTRPRRTLDIRRGVPSRHSSSPTLRNVSA